MTVILRMRKQALFLKKRSKNFYFFGHASMQRCASKGSKSFWFFFLKKNFLPYK